MITYRSAVSIERRPRMKVDLDGNARAFGIVGPQQPGCEYVTFCLGYVRRGERVTLEDIEAALSHYRALLRAVLAQPVEVGQ